MNIALLHYSAPPIVGGVESVIAHQARLCADAGHHVTLFVGRGEAFDARIPVRVLPRLDSRHPDIMALKGQLDNGNVPPEFDVMRDALHTELQNELREFDVLIAHNVASLHKNLALTAALRLLQTIRVIVWHHDLAWTTPRYRAELHPGYPWDLLRAHWDGATHIVVSAWRRRELADLLNVPLESIRVIPNGVDINAFFKLEARTQVLLTQLPILSADPFLLLPVRLTPRKNIELALHTLAALRADYPNALLLVTGPEGPHNPLNADYKHRLFALRDALNLRDAAYFLAELTADFLPDAVIADFYRLADALFMPSREEGFGIPIIEAAFSHLPVFCADLPVLRELGGDDVTYFDPDADPTALAHVIAARLHREATARWARRARQGYAWPQIYATHIAPLLDEVLHENN